MVNCDGFNRVRSKNINDAIKSAFKIIPHFIIACIKQAMKPALDSTISSDESHQVRTIRKLSLFPQQFPQWEEPVDTNQLIRLGNYISSNIQSERKSILELYSTSICLLNKNQHAAIPELLSPTAKKSFKRKLAKQALLTLSPMKGNCSQQMANDRDFIVSNHFPSKFIKKQKNRLQLLIRQQSPVKKKQVPPILHKQNENVATVERTGVNLSKIAIRKKLPKLHKSKSKQDDPSQLNPWEYLQIQDEPIFSNL